MVDEHSRSPPSLASQPTVTPSDTTYQTSFGLASRRSSGRDTTSSFAPGTPASLPQDGPSMARNQFEKNDEQDKRSSREISSALHAQLVQQIHQGREDLRIKDTQVDSLEAAWDDQKSINERLKIEAKEARGREHTLLRNFTLLEQDTVKAVEDAEEERDVAKKDAKQYQIELRTAKDHLKAEQDYNDQLHKERELQQTRSEQEKSTLLRKISVLEGRLKSVVEEFTAQSLLSQAPTPTAEADKENVAPLGDGIASLHSSPTKARKTHRRNQSSVSSLGSFRNSKAFDGTNLADELDLDSGDDVASDGDAPEHNVLSKEVRDSRDSLRSSKARKVLGIVSGVPEKHADETLPADALGKLEGEGSQKSEPAMGGDIVAATHRLAEAVYDQTQATTGAESDVVGANQRRKRDPLVRNATSHSRSKSEPLSKAQPNQDVASEVVPSPPGSPGSIKSFVSAVGTNMQGPVSRPDMASTSTQTDVVDEPRKSSPPPPARAPPPVPTEVPSISIHSPDGSEPSSPTETVLPPRTRSTGCQTDFIRPISQSDAGVQTDVIRVDRRAIKLPAHLLPSALDTEYDLQSRAATSRSQDLHDTPSTNDAPALSPTDYYHPEYPSSNQGTEIDGHPSDIAEGFWSKFRKTTMKSASNRSARASDIDPFVTHEDTSLSDGDHTHHLPTAKAKRPQKYTRPPFDPPTPVPENEKVGATSRPPVPRVPSGSSRGSFERHGAGSRHHSYIIKGRHASRPSDATSSQRPGSPSSARSSGTWSKGSGPAPPIQIPMRTSSAGLGKRRSGGATSPTRRSGASSPTKRSDGVRIGKKLPLRKVKSMGVAPSEVVDEHQPFSPLSRASFASAELSPSPVPGSASLPPQTIPEHGHVRSSSSQTRRLSSFLPTGNASLGANDQHTVAHALTETSIGESMFKYARKRSSFVMTRDQGHRRWFWVNPHERTLMWGSKRPQSEKAQLGQRKNTLIIEKVIDVKDDVTSKGPRKSFNQAIMLGSAGRMMKFVAPTRERHYLWLTALSFLAAHTSNDSMDLTWFAPQASVAPGHEVSRSTSGNVSRSSRKPWSSRNRSRQSSGYATPSIPEASASVEGSSLTTDVPPRPKRPAPPPPPPEHNLPDTALAPSIPRIPGSHSSSRTNLHSRKRSASITGVISRSGSSKANSGNSSVCNYPSYYSNPSGAQSSVNSAPPSSTTSRPPVPSLPSSRQGRANVSTRHFGPFPGSSQASKRPSTASQHHPSTPTFDEPDPRQPEFTLGVEEVLDGMGDSGGIRTEFGTNNSFFDAAGRKRSGYNPRRSGQIFDDPPTQAQMAAAARSGRELLPSTGGGGLSSHPVEDDEYEEVESGPGHANSTSIDSVAPPPIQRSVAPQAQGHGQSYAQRQTVAGSSECGQVPAPNNFNGRRKWF